MHLKGFGLVKVFRTVFKNEFRHYIIYRPDPDKIAEVTLTQFMDIHARHWQVEFFHRAVKQVTNIERFFLRQAEAISNHIFAAISAFVYLQLRCIHNLITNCYALKRNLFNDVIHSFIVKNLVDYNYLLPANLFPPVNA